MNENKLEDSKGFAALLRRQNGVERTDSFP